MNKNVKFNSSKIILVAYFNNPEHCMPTYDAICFLARKFKIIIVARNATRLNYSYPKNVFVNYIGSELQFGQFKYFVHTFFDYVLFSFYLIYYAVNEKVALFLCYDLYAFVAVNLVKIFSRNIPIFYHQNETSLLREVKKFSFAYWLKTLEIFFVRYAQELSFPEPNRAKCFLRDAVLNKDVIIVENCPLRLNTMPIPSEDLMKLKDKGCKIILHRGPIDDGFAMDIHETISSIKYWPQNSLLVLIGFRTQKDEMLCNEIINELGFKDRVMFLPFIKSREEMFSYIAASDVGLVLYKPIFVNRKFVAPVKLYDYFACGVPVIVPKALPYLSELVEKLSVGFSYEDSSPEKIGKKIRLLLESPDRIIMGKRARDEHLNKLNFEEQFSPLFKEIEKFAT